MENISIVANGDLTFCMNYDRNNRDERKDGKLKKQDGNERKNQGARSKMHTKKEGKK